MYLNHAGSTCVCGAVWGYGLSSGCSGIQLHSLISLSLYCCRRSRGLAPTYARNPLITDDMALGSSYSLSHGSTSRDKDAGSSSHSWFGWLKGDSSSSRERGVDQPDGVLGSSAQAVDKPRNEHEEVQVSGERCCRCDHGVFLACSLSVQHTEKNRRSQLICGQFVVGRQFVGFASVRAFAATLQVNCWGLDNACDVLCQTDARSQQVQVLVAASRTGSADCRLRWQCLLSCHKSGHSAQH